MKWSYRLLAVCMICSLVLAGGCNRTSDPPVPEKKPSLDSKDAKERVEAAQEAAKNYGAKQ